MTEADAICAAKVQPTTAVAINPPFLVAASAEEDTTEVDFWNACCAGGETKALAALAEIAKRAIENFMVVALIRWLFVK